MEKLVIIRPFEGKCGEFKNFIENICFHIQDESEEFKEYINFCKLNIPQMYKLKNLDFGDLYRNMSEEIDLWKISPKDFGIKKESILYSEFTDIILKENFIPAPRLSVFLLPIILKEEKINFEPGIRILKPLRLLNGEFHRSKGAIIENNRKTNSKTTLIFFDLKPSEYYFTPGRIFLVKKFKK